MTFFIRRKRHRRGIEQFCLNLVACRLHIDDP
jgi:hypothetical protein